MTRLTQAEIDEALATCEREKIHIPGRIQSFGSLLAFDRHTLTVTHVSDNLNQVSQHAPAELLGTNVDDAFPCRELAHAIRGVTGLPSLAAQRERFGVFQMAGHSWDAAASMADGLVIIELEKIDLEPAQSTPPVAVVRSMMGQLRANAGVQGMLESAVTSIRRLTGYDRVMAYKFLERGDGEVVAEACSPAVEPYLGLRYPSSDIPRNVREVMMKNPFRTLVDIEDPHSRILSIDSANDLNLTLTHVRGISPIHVEYLRNMGVASTMNMGIIVRGTLWGMFALHHYRPRLLNPERRSICELFGHFLSLQLQQQVEQGIVNRRRHIDATLRSLRDVPSGDFHETFSKHAETLARVANCDGIALVDQTQQTVQGTVPSDAVLKQIAEASSDDAFAVDSLDTIAAGVEESRVAGALALKLNPKLNSSIVFLRQEVMQHVRWAGADQTKNIQKGPDGLRLSPRSSFAEYRELVRGRCEPWTEADMMAAIEIRSALRDIAFYQSDLTAAESEKQRKHADLLVAELNHRVKNILALVRSIATQTQNSARSLEQFTTAFEKRIAALAKAHDLIGGGAVQWAKIGELLDAELQPYQNVRATISRSGPSIAFRPDVAPMVALVLHELTSNAVKHGALSQNGKRLDIVWERSDSGLVLSWKETLIAPPDPPSRTGFGMTLIKGAVPHELNGSCSVDFTTNGLEAEFWFPVDAVRVVEQSASLDITYQAEEDGEVDRQDRVAIVVEDNMVLAMEMEALLESQGFRTIHSFGNTQSCKDGCPPQILSTVEVAVLDINLGNETSVALADWLFQQNIPIIFVTGYDNDIDLPETLSSIPRLRKPVDRRTLAEKIQEVTGASR